MKELGDKQKIDQVSFLPSFFTKSNFSLVSVHPLLHQIWGFDLFLMAVPNLKQNYAPLNLSPILLNTSPDPLDISSRRSLLGSAINWITVSLPYSYVEILALKLMYYYEVDLWKVFKAWEWSPNEWNWGPYKRGPIELPRPFCHVRTQW